MIFRKLGIILSGLLLSGCKDGEPANYYSYLQIVKEQPKVTPVDESKLNVSFKISENIKITDTSKTENIKVNISFNGLMQVFSDDLHFELFANDQKISLPDTVSYTITTVIENSVKYFKSEETTLNVKEVLNKVKNKNGIPDSISYFSVAGMIQNIPLNNTHNPPLLKLHVKVFSKGNLFYNQEQIYELKRPTLYKPKNRPFG